MENSPLWAAWHQGAVLFNQGQHWEAHHAWEVGWKTLPSPLKENIQGMIQFCGILVHLKRGNTQAAARLCLSCQRHLQLGQSLEFQGLVMEGGMEYLKELQGAFESPSAEALNPRFWLGKADVLKVTVREVIP